MSTNDYIANVIDNLTAWSIDYRETTEGISVGSIHLEVVEDGYGSLGTILDDTETVAITSDADKAAALLAFPLARKAWGAGYTGDFEVDVHDGMVEVRFSYGSDDLSIYATIDSDLEFTITDHPLFYGNVDMTDLKAALESTQLAYQSEEEAWQVLCGSADFERDDWSSIVELFHERVCFHYSDRLTKVSTSESENMALVEDYGSESPIRVINVDMVSDVMCWGHSDVAAAILYAIS